MLALVALIVLSACSNSAVLGPEPATSAAADVIQGAATRIELGVGESAMVASATITFVGVTDDSRCPTGVTCVWEGDAIVTISARREGETAESVSLHANPRFAQEASAAGLHVRLLRLEPYPEADRQIAAGDYRVALSVNTD